MKKTQLFLQGLLVATLISSCSKDDPTSPGNPQPSITYDNGVFISCEGPFGSGTGRVDFYSRTTGSVTQDIFQQKNGYPLGNIVQSIELFNGKAYVVINNSGKLEVADGNTFASAGVITGLTYPRFFLGINSAKAYVSEYGSGGLNGNVKVINLANNTVSATIPTGLGAEGMLRTMGKVFVACGGGFGNDSVVTVIDEVADTVITNIVVGANPKSIRRDGNGDIWVLCAGQWNSTFTALEKPGSLVRIDAGTYAITRNFSLVSSYSQPSSLVVSQDGTMLYYCFDSKVFAQASSFSTLNGTALISRSFYSLGLDPENGVLFCADAGDFSSNGKVLRYNVSGFVIDSFATGIIPGNFYFK